MQADLWQPDRLSAHTCCTTWRFHQYSTFSLNSKSSEFGIWIADGERLAAQNFVWSITEWLEGAGTKKSHTFLEDTTRIFQAKNRIMKTRILQNNPHCPTETMWTIGVALVLLKGNRKLVLTADNMMPRCLAPLLPRLFFWDADCQRAPWGPAAKSTLTSHRFYCLLSSCPEHFFLRVFPPLFCPFISSFGI